MPFVPATGAIQAEMVMSQDGEVVENVLHYVSAAAVSEATMTELAELLLAQWDASIRPLQSDTVFLDIIRVTDLSSQFAMSFDYTIGLPIQGGTFSNAMPNNVTIVFTKKTVQRGRSRRGRLYHVGLTEEQVIGNNMNATVRANLLIAYQTLITLTGALSTYTLSIVSRWENNAQRSFALLTPVIAFSTDGVIDSQRRRLPGRGS